MGKNVDKRLQAMKDSHSYEGAGRVATDVLGVGFDVINAITSMFGVDLRKFFKRDNKSLDYTNALNAINKAFGQLEIEDTKKLNKIQRQLDSLIQMPNSPTIKKFLNNIKNNLNDSYNQVIKRQANRDLRKAEAQALANDIDNASFGDYGSVDFQRKAGRLEDLVVDAANEAEDSNVKKELNNIPGWDKVDQSV